MLTCQTSTYGRDIAYLAVVVASSTLLAADDGFGVWAVARNEESGAAIQSVLEQATLMRKGRTSRQSSDDNLKGDRELHGGG
jgi:hypothetical protein